MALPPIAPFPPAGIRDGMMPEEWQLCLDSWISLTRLHLQLSDDSFMRTSAKDQALLDFLTSYIHENSQIHNVHPRSDQARLKALRRNVFLLCHRLLLETKPLPPSLLNWKFLADLSAVYVKSASLKHLLGGLWAGARQQLEPSLTKLKISLTKDLERPPKGGSKDLEETMIRLFPLLRASPDAGVVFMTGSDFLDALSTGFVSADPTLRKRLVAVAYLGLLSLSEATTPNLSLLLDHLYSLKAFTDAQKKPAVQMSLLADLMTDTPLLQQLRERFQGLEASRARSLFASFETFRTAPGAHPRTFVKRSPEKAKSRATHDFSHSDKHVHRMSLISQIQDLFPDLGSGFIAKLLDYFDEDVEQVTAHLLDDSLPSHLTSLDRSLPLDSHPPRPSLSPRATPPPSSPPSFLPQRRNIHDESPLTPLSVPASRLHYGHKTLPQTADSFLSTAPTPTHKSAILAALSTFDLDDDERDDTYDAEDVGGSVDVTASLADGSPHDETLFQAWKSTPHLFGRDALTRRGAERADLKARTGLTDEAIEGWGVMLQREPRRARQLESRYGGAGGFSGEQAVVGSSRWQDGGDAEGEREHPTNRGRGGRIRGGRGRGGGGRGEPATAGPANDRSTQLARQNKEKGRGRGGANHNRREGRAKKMARGGFGP